MKKFLCFIFAIVLIFACVGCDYTVPETDVSNDNNSSQNIHTFFNDFEEENLNSIWKKQYIKNDSLAFSGNNVCECPPDLLYAFGFDLNMDDSIGNDD